MAYENQKSIPVGALWQKKSKKGTTFLTGTINLKDIGGKDQDIQVVGFKVTEKKNPNQPDIQLFQSQPYEGGGGQRSQAPAKKYPPKKQYSEPAENDDSSGTPPQDDFI